jgi:hypothetical protein
MDLFPNTRAVSMPWDIIEYIIAKEKRMAIGIYILAPTIEVANNSRQSGQKIMDQTIQRDLLST